MSAYTLFSNYIALVFTVLIALVFFSHASGSSRFVSARFPCYTCVVVGYLQNSILIVVVMISFCDFSLAISKPSLVVAAEIRQDEKTHLRWYFSIGVTCFQKLYNYYGKSLFRQFSNTLSKIIFVSCCRPLDDFQNHFSEKRSTGSKFQTLVELPACACCPTSCCHPKIIFSDDLILSRAVGHAAFF